MTIRKIMLVMLLFMLALPITSCTMDEIPIDRDVAIMIASADVPSSVIEQASVVTAWDNGKWTVYFLLTGDKTITKSEVGWLENPNTKFENQGMLPNDTYRLLVFTIDRRTGVVLSRVASDSVLLGGPGTFNTEPTQMILLPVWWAIAAGIGGLVVGGVVVWLIMHRNKINV